MVKKLKVFEFEKVLDIFQITGNEVVHADDVEAFFDKAVAEMGAEEARSAGN